MLEMDTSHLPAPNITLNIAGLGPCTDNPDRSLHLDSSQPLNILVHGCFGSSGNFRGLAQVLAFHGQQTACFTYNDRDGLNSSASELRESLKQLADQTKVPKITVIGHSQGALIARKSLAQSLATELPDASVKLALVTISGPFSGIESARTCGRTILYPLSLGLVPLSCYLITGEKWADITYSSNFILQPGKLDARVLRHIKIDTDERNTCRQQDAGKCIESDDIFSLAEQRNAKVENDARVKRVAVNAGHVEIVGTKLVAPTKLITILQEQDILQPTASKHQADLNRLLARIYGDAHSLQH